MVFKLLALLSVLHFTTRTSEPAVSSGAEHSPTVEVDKNSSLGERHAKEKALLIEAYRRVQRWLSEGGVKNSRKLLIVYFTPKDAAPLPDYRRRLDGALNHIRNFYAKQMEENGLPPLTFDFDREADGIAHVRLLVGDRNHADYTTASIEDEVEDSVGELLKTEGIDLKKNHVLVVCNLPEMEDDENPKGKAVIDVCAEGTASAGIAWVCDKPELDVGNLKPPSAKSANATHPDEERAEKAGNAIGDIAHELGHAFSLEHMAESKAEARTKGTSLMSSGNECYAAESYGRGKGTFLNGAALLSLLAQPIFTGIDRSVDAKPSIKFSGLSSVMIGQVMHVTGRLNSDGPPVYALVARICPVTGGGEYESTVFMSSLDEKTGEFSFDIKNAHTAPAQLEIFALQANGCSMKAGIVSLCFPGRKQSDADQFNLDWAFAEARERYAAGDKRGALLAVWKAGEAKAGNPGMQKRAEAWERALFRSDDSTVPADCPHKIKSLNLARCHADAESPGLARTPPSHDLIPDKKMGPISQIGPRDPEGFLAVHAIGKFAFALGGKWKKLTGRYGVQKGDMGAMGLIISGDGKVLFAGKRTGGYWDSQKAVEFTVDVTGIKTLEFSVTNGGGSGGEGWSIIADPIITR